MGEGSARETTSPNKTPWLNRTIAGVSLTSLFSDMSHETATAMLPLFVATLVGGPIAAAAPIGLIEGASDGASSAIKSYSGYWTDKTGKRTSVMYLGYALTGFLIPAIGFATSWLQILALRVAGWMGRGARGPPRDALMSESVAPETRGKAFGFQRAFDTIGATIGIALAYLLIPRLAIPSIYFLTLIPGIASVVVVVALVRSKARVPHPNHPSFLHAVRGLPTRFRLFLVGVGLFGLVNFSNTIFNLRALQILAPSQGQTGAADVAVLLLLVLNVVYAASSYPAGFLADRVSKRFLLAGGYGLFGLACLVSVFEIPSIPILLTVFILAGLSTGVVDAVEGAYTADFLDSSQRGVGYGVLQTVNGVGDFVSSALIGVLITLVSPAAGFGLFAGLSFAAGALLVTLTGK
ncbi:MAG: MFS transporter [Nitrososphaerota archaeon]|nr:MFS transporter [Nitrososphaerota archaeon]MDG6975496.1 MFS transporter [Nitrososphaerota archaeon]MDG7009895.1 MFS transporter [Nitrososphaerota archaeon]MDG7028330.1 MFS transporter [Nitrososphaerota archaeon]MDG7030715.1 MFS transporter [Nitrososphaerota archaeon]